MVDKKISELNELTVADTDDVLLIVDTSATETKKIQFSNIEITEGQISDFGTYLENISSDTTPQLGGDLDLNDKSFTREETAGEALVAGDVCYLKSDGKYWKADASAEATAEGDLLLATESISADATGTFIELGEYTTTGLTAGSIYYMSETAGTITATAPTTSGSIVRIVGYAKSTTVFVFKPDVTYIEVS